MIKVLLAHRADLMSRTSVGWPALQTTVEYHQVELIRVPLAHGAELGGKNTGGAALMKHLEANMILQDLICTRR